MVRKYPVFVISQPEDATYYRSFPLHGEELMIIPFGQAICSVLCHQIDLILIDCGFDARMGLGLLEDLKARFSGIPIVFVTEQSSEEIILRAFKLGARDFFQKPLPVFNVRDTLMALLNAKREVREHRGLSSLRDDDQLMNGNLCQIGVLRPAVMKVVCHIESNYQTEISLAQMANLANMSKYHFVRIFSRETGMSPVRYLKFIRIQRAKELLKRSDLSVFSAAVRVGFQDVSNFNKNFKNIEGCTPSQYRASLI